MSKAAAVFASLRSHDTHAALNAVTQLLYEDEDSPYFLVQRALLIQAADNYGHFTLEDAERDLERAHRLDPRFPPALQELAHFYDAVSPNPGKARHFAQLYLDEVSDEVAAMKGIVEAED